MVTPSHCGLCWQPSGGVAVVSLLIGPTHHCLLTKQAMWVNTLHSQLHRSTDWFLLEGTLETI